MGSDWDPLANVLPQTLKQYVFFTHKFDSSIGLSRNARFIFNMIVPILGPMSLKGLIWACLWHVATLRCAGWVLRSQQTDWQRGCPVVNGSKHYMTNCHDGPCECRLSNCLWNSYSSFHKHSFTELLSSQHSWPTVHSVDINELCVTNLHNRLIVYMRCSQFVLIKMLYIINSLDVTFL